MSSSEDWDLLRQAGKRCTVCESSLHCGQREIESIMHSFLVTGSDISWPLDNLGGRTLSNAYLSGFLYELIQPKNHPGSSDSM